MKAIDGILSHSYGWLEHKLYMDNMPLSAICNYLERWYNVQIILDSNISDEQAYTFSIKDESLDEILRLMSHIYPIQYDFREENIVVITNK